MSNDGSHAEAVHAMEHAEDEEHGGHGGHGADPNDGVVVGTPPTPAWIWTVALIGLVTVAGCVLLAVKIG